MANFYKVLDNGQIKKITTDELKAIALRLANHGLTGDLRGINGAITRITIEEAKTIIGDHWGDCEADSVCFSYAEARAIAANR